MTTRSAVLFVGSTTVRRSELDYSCPAGEVDIVKSIAYSQRDAIAHTCQINLQRSSLAVNIRLLFEDLQPDAHGVLSVWLVLEAGDRLVFYSPGTLFQVWVSGTRLPQWT